MTSSHKTRHKNKMQYEFAYINYVHEVTFENGTKKYPSSKVDYHTKERKSHVTLYNDPRRNKKKLLPLIENHEKILFTCLNDKIDHSQKTAAAAEEDVKVNFYDVLFPTPSKFEWISTKSSTVGKTKVDDEKVEETSTGATAAINETKAAKPIIYEAKNHAVDEFIIQTDTSSANWSRTVAFYAGGTTLTVVSMLKLRRKFR